MGKVTDPGLLAALEAPPLTGKVADPALLSQLNASEPQPESLGSQAARWLGETGRGLVTAASRLAEFADPAVAAAAAAGSYALPYSDGSFGERWHREMDALRSSRNESQRQAPTANLIGTVLPLVLAPAALGAAPSLSAATGASTLPVRMLAGYTDAAAWNTANALGRTAGQKNVNPLDVGNEAASSPANLLGMAAPVIRELIPATGAALRGAVKRTADKWFGPPTKAAAMLEAEGIPLTAGQRSAGSAGSYFEEANAHKLGGLAAERAAGPEALRDAFLRRSLPPGMAEVPQSGTIQEKLAKIYEGFEPAYAPIKAESVFPAIRMNGRGVPLQGSKNTAGAFDLAAQDPNVLADDATRAMVQRYLNNQLTLLPGKTSRPGMVEPVEAQVLLKMRSNIRKAALRAHNSGKTDAEELLGNAEDALTQAVGTQLPPEKAAYLQNVDRQYSNYKTVVKAAGRAGLDSEFTPAQIGAQIRTRIGAEQFGRGGGGDIRDLAQAGNEVFETQVPKTGFVGAIGEHLPLSKFYGGLLSRALNAASRSVPLLPQAVTPPWPAVPYQIPGAGLLGQVGGPNLTDAELEALRKGR